MADEYLLPSERPEPAATTGGASAKPAEQPYLLPSEQEEQAAAKEAARPSQNPLVAGWEATKEAAHGVWKGLGPAETPTEGPLESATRIGGGLLSAAGLPFAPFVGAGKSVIAHGVAPLLRGAEYGIKKGVQQVKPDFDPKVQTHQEAYEALLPGAEAAISAIGPKRLPSGAVAPIAPVRKAPSGGLTTKSGQEVYAGKMLEQAASDPEAAIGALDAAKEIVPGSKPTTFQATGDLGLGQMERVVQNTPEGQAAFQQRWAEQNNARVNALRSLHEEGADAEAVSNHLRTAMRADDATAEIELAAARARAEAADAQLGANVTPEISGQVMRRELDMANNAARTQERQLWEAVDPNGTLLVNSGPVSNAQFRIYGDMTQAGAASMSEAERTISGIIGQYPPTTSFREMRDLRGLVSAEMRNELFNRGQTPTYARLTQLRGAIEESVSRPVSMQTGQLAPEVAGRLQEASAATRQRAETFKQQPVAGALKREQGQGPYAVTNAAVPQRFIPSGPRGYDHVASYLRAVGNERGLPDVYDALVSDMRSHAMDRDGSINSDRLVRWAMGKQHALRAVSERDGNAFVTRLRNVEMANQAIADTAAARNAAQVARSEGIFGRLIGANNPTDVQNIIGGVFGKQTSVGDAQAIMARLRASPEAQVGARQAIVDWIWDKFISNTAAGTTDENIIRADQFQQFIKLKEQTLRAFGFTPDQISTWQMISDDMRQTKMSIDATKMRGGPGTAQDLNAMYEMRERLGTSLFSKITWRLMAGSLGWAVEGPVGGAAAMLGAGVINSMRDRGIRSVQDLVKSAMMNPGVARRLLAKARGREVMPWQKTWMGYESSAQQQPSPQGLKHGGAVRPLGREGIQARNKARAVAARERSTLARQSAEAKRKVRRADGGVVPYATDSPEFKEEVAKALATSQDAIAAKQDFYPRVPLNDKAWTQFIEDAPASLNIEDRRPGYKGGLRAAHRRADGGEVNDDSSNVITKDGEPIDPKDRSKIPGPNEGLISVGKAVAPNLTSVLTEPEEPYSKRLGEAGGSIGKEGEITPPPSGKIPSTADPRMREAEQEGFDLASAMVPVGGAAKVGALAVAPLIPGAKRAAAAAKPLAKEAAVGLGQFPTTTPGRILGKTQKGGYSVNVPTGEIPSEGLMMGIYGNKDPRNLVVEGRGPTKTDVVAHAERNLAALQKPERHYGTWRDPETGITYFDVSQRFPSGDIRQATKFGERTGQISGYNVGEGKTFPVGNWEEFIKSPEFHARMLEQADKGGEYLSKFPTREWWDMRGGPFENVYGSANMPQTAGFTASTAPNTKPIENLQHMSEYMRRHIRGEPVVQPEWRAPEGNMNLAAGKQMSLEQSRIANLRKAAAGDLDELSRRKVRSEALAMMGDKRAVVLDRHWARLGEAPERGIYTGTEEGVISSEVRKSKLSPYQIMENEVVKAADNRGRDPRDFSADAWTGIRETIKTTGQLYGQQFKGSAIQGESKSYADHFVDLIQRKAAHMRMSVDELERRLRGGDANLLSQMLAMPTIAGAYSYWLAGQEQTGSASIAGAPATPSAPLRSPGGA